ncbi:metallophosphoesterase [Aliisedimentitalea sp. MJ-SS2]|uniref:metallophosphoesterase family protein n=1 Tax=Aliisedimentitalea sp. MJ-SS2 TaxID=3049795 RepID=UPI002930EEC6|nr:metallophosphoesterase [Alisedimentitalea sp. MJ-SS2]
MSVTRQVVGILCGLALATGAAGASDQAASVQYAWVQHGGPSGAVVRAISTSKTCPQLNHDGEVSKMHLRMDAPPHGFEGIYVCEAGIAQTAQGLSIGPVALPPPAKVLDRVAVIGDTGCRVNYGEVQNCTGDGNGPAWDYQGIADAAAKSKPDVVIHVGDMHYREHTSACGQSCKHENIGFNWHSWEADFFHPSKTLMQAAPWIMVRGNHEDCGRAWRGWFYFLDPNPMSRSTWPLDCPAASEGEKSWFYTDPYSLEFDGVRVIVMDSSYIADDYHTPDPATVAQYASEFGMVEDMAGQDAKPSWLVTHRPFWAVASWGTSNAGPTDATLQAALAASTQGKLPDNVKVTLAGHIHLMQSLSFADGRPQQMVFGNSGTKRDPGLADNGQLHANVVRALARLGVAQTGFAWSETFDFGLITPDANGWTAAVKAKDGSTIASFPIQK